MSKKKQSVTTGAAKVGLTVKYMSDCVAVTLLMAIIALVINLALRGTMIKTGMLSVTAVKVVNDIIGIISGFYLAFAAIITVKWAKKNLEITGSQKVTTGINIYLVALVCFRMFSIAVEYFVTYRYQGLDVLEMVTITIQIIAAIVAMKYFEYYEEQNVIKGEDVGAEKVKGIVFDWIFAVLVVIAAIILIGSNIYRLANIDKIEAQYNGGVNANKGNDVNNTTKVEYKEYKVGDEITLSDGSKWKVVKNSGTTEDYVTVLGQEDYATYLQGDNWDAVTDQMYKSFVEYKGSALDKYMQSQQSRVTATLKEVDGYKIRLITLDELFALDNNWIESTYGGYKYTKSNWSNSIPMGITTMTLVSAKDREYGKQWAYYNVGKTTCYADNCTEEYFITTYGAGLGGFYPVVNIYKKSI